MPKFDFIVQNPPYHKSFHLKFLENGYDILSDKGKMVIIEPATWLINVRKEGKAKIYDKIKEKTKEHIYKVIIENYNKEFNTGMYATFAITYIDKSKIYDKIWFSNCGEIKEVESIYDCNLVGNYKTIHSILSKCQKYGNMMKDHIYKGENNNEKYFMRISNILTNHGYNSDVDYIDYKDKQYYGFYITPCCHKNDRNIYYEEIPLTMAKNISACVYSENKNELENWKHFVFSNKLPLFINICVTIAQNNNSGKYIPWIVNKQYTDEEIYDMLSITNEEQEFIDNILKKYERYSPWFKRYMCGIDTQTSNE